MRHVFSLAVSSKTIQLFLKLDKGLYAGVKLRPLQSYYETSAYVTLHKPLLWSIENTEIVLTLEYAPVVFEICVKPRPVCSFKDPVRFLLLFGYAHIY